MLSSVRLPFVFLVSVALVTVSGCGRSGAANHSDLPPPNILWITCEDISPALGCYGDPYANTPTLDQLAKEGVLYRHAYATAPICSPARSTLISGVYATSMGTQHLRSDIPMPEDFRILPQYLTEAGYFCSNNSKTDYNFSPEGRWDDQGNEAHWRNRNEDQPFFSVFNYGITHEGPTNRLDEADVESLETRHDPELADLPPYFPDTPEMRRIWARQYDLISVLDQQVEALIDQLKEDGLYENTIIFYFSDHGFGLPRYKRWLYKTGLQVPLIVRIPDKYRHLQTADPASEDHQLVSFVDFAPSVLNLAGLEIPEHMAGKPFLGEDPALSNRYIYGARSRADDAYEISRCVLDDRYIYIRHFMPHQAYVYDAIIYSDMKAGFRELRRLKGLGELNPEADVFWQPKVYEELYDLQKDPHELVNVAGEPEYQEKKSELQMALYTWILEHRDMGLLNESDMMVRSSGTSPYTYGATDAYPVEQVLEAANLCGKPGVDQEEILATLDHPDPGIRYWGVLSLQAAQASGESSAGVVDPLIKAISDPSPTVAIAAGETLFHMGYQEEGLDVIGRYLEEAPHPTVVLQAAISARNLGSGAEPLIPLINRVFPQYRGEVWGRYKDWVYPMFIGFALDQVYLNCGLEIPE